MSPTEMNIEWIATVRWKSEQRLLRAMSMVSFITSCLWALWCLNIGSYYTASLCVVYMAAAGISLLSIQTERAERFSRHLFLSAGGLIPFGLQITLGGWESSGIAMLWCLPVLVAAVNLKAGAIRYAYLITIGILFTGFALWDPSLAASELPSSVLAKAMLAINLTGSMVASFALADHMLKTQRDLRKRVFALQQEASEHFVNTLEERHADMQHSLDYAARIQMALWPDMQRMQGIFKETNVFYQPKEAVGGDFVWYARVEDRSYYIVLDCTGHGVPGSLMSMLIHGLLNEVVHTGKNLGAAEVVRRTQQLLNDRLNRDRTGNTDGAEMAVICFDHTRREVRCCSYGCGIIVQNEEGTIHLKNRSGNSSLMQGSLAEQLNEHVLTIDSDTRLFLYTDGVADQFCANDKRKFSRTRLEYAIGAGSHLSPKAQMERFENEFEAWRGDTPPVDDMLLVSAVVASCWKSIEPEERETSAA